MGFDRGFIAMDAKGEQELEAAAASEDDGSQQRQEDEPATDVEADAPEADEFDEEDAWIAEEIERQERQLHEEERDQSVTERYTPRFMDTAEIRALNSALRRKEVQLHKEGRMREYTPQRPPMPPESLGLSRRHSRHSGGGAMPLAQTTRCPIWSKSDNKNDGSMTARSEPAIASRPPSPRTHATPSTQKRVELTQALRVEMMQVRELEQRYADMKRVLLDHLEMICTSKLSDRVASPENFEQLTELMEYALQCASSKMSI